MKRCLLTCTSPSPVYSGNRGDGTSQTGFQRDQLCIEGRHTHMPLSKPGYPNSWIWGSASGLFSEAWHFGRGMQCKFKLALQGPLLRTGTPCSTTSVQVSERCRPNFCFGIRQSASSDGFMTSDEQKSDMFRNGFVIAIYAQPQHMWPQNRTICGSFKYLLEYTCTHCALKSRPA